MQGNYTVASEKQFLQILSEELKQQVARVRLMLATNSAAGAIDQELMRTLRTIEHVQMLYDFMENPQQMHLGPVHLGHVLQEAAYEMRPLELLRDSTSQLQLQHGMQTVHADQRLLKASIIGIWQAMLDYVPAERTEIIWHAQSTKKGIRLKVGSKHVDMRMLRVNANTLRAGKTKQPFKSIAGPATDLVAASMMMQLLGSGLRTAKSSGNYGLHIVMQPSMQLQLV